MILSALCYASFVCLIFVSFLLRVMLCSYIVLMHSMQEESYTIEPLISRTE